MSDPCCNVPQINKQPAMEEQSQQSTVYLQIQGMNCHNCANRVRNSLISTYGVTSVIIDLGQGLAEVQFNPSLAAPDALVSAVSAAGGDGHHEYRARLLPTQ